MLWVNVQCTSTPERTGVEKRAGLLLSLLISCTSALHPSNPVSRGNEKELLIQSDLCSQVPSLLLALVPWVSSQCEFTVRVVFLLVLSDAFGREKQLLNILRVIVLRKPQLFGFLCSYTNTCNAPDVAIVALSLPLSLQHCYSSRARRRGRWVVGRVDDPSFYKFYEFTSTNIRLPGLSLALVPNVLGEQQLNVFALLFWKFKLIGGRHTTLSYCFFLAYIFLFVKQNRSCEYSLCFSLLQILHCLFRFLGVQSLDLSNLLKKHFKVTFVP